MNVCLLGLLACRGLSFFDINGAVLDEVRITGLWAEISSRYFILKLRTLIDSTRKPFSLFGYIGNVSRDDLRSQLATELRFQWAI